MAHDTKSARIKRFHKPWRNVVACEKSLDYAHKRSGKLIGSGEDGEMLLSDLERLDAIAIWKQSKRRELWRSVHPRLPTKFEIAELDRKLDRMSDIDVLMHIAAEAEYAEAHPRKKRRK